MINTKSSDTFTRALACAAISPGLRSILVFNATSMDLREIANDLAPMLKSATGQEARQEYLGSSERDDDLWGSLLLPDNHTRGTTRRIPQLFSRERNSNGIQLIVIPDLTTLSLAVARACTVLMSADVVHLERNGQKDQWQPHYCWIAGCSNDKRMVGTVSPHLLDRFALRLTWVGSKDHNVQQRVSSILANLNPPFSTNSGSADIPAELHDRIKKAMSCKVEFLPEPLNSVVGFTPNERYYPRRELALARLAVALAQFSGDKYLTVDRVNEAATIMGLEAPGKIQLRLGNASGQGDKNYNQLVGNQAHSGKKQVPSQNSGIIPLEHTSEVLDQAEPIHLAADPYPEDTALIEREATPLRLSPPRYAFIRSDRGPIIGVEQADTLQDLAVVSTLQRAAMFQVVRRKHISGEYSHLLFDRSDLRCYRRGPVSDQMLLLLLDYTGLRRSKWQDAVVPHLNWAYVERASITIVKVGAADAKHELRAEQVDARNILGPQIEAALEIGYGCSTPLAHGFDLTLRRLLHVLQHGRSTVRQVRLVVASDGRGNVTLEASYAGQVLSAIGREGVEDALQIAYRIGHLKNVETVLLNPQPKYYSDLPLLFARALHGQVDDIKLIESMEV